AGRDIARPSRGPVLSMVVPRRALRAADGQGRRRRGATGRGHGDAEPHGVERSHLIRSVRPTLLYGARGGIRMSIAKVGAIDLYYDEQGSGDPLLLVMGLAADSAAWLFQVPDLSRTYRTVCF